MKMNMSNVSMENLGMTKNVGAMEGRFRLIAGVAALAALPFVRGKWTKTILGTLAASGISTGASRFCPINAALGMNRSEDKDSHAIAEAVPLTRNKAFDRASAQEQSDTSAANLHH